MTKRTYYSYGPEVGVHLFDTEQDAQADARALLELHRDYASDRFWHEEVDQLQWGYLVPVERVHVKVTPAPSGAANGPDYWEVSLQRVTDGWLLERARLRARLAVYAQLCAELARHGQQDLAQRYMRQADDAATRVRSEDLVTPTVGPRRKEP